jgi:hypothetical protein
MLSDYPGAIPIRFIDGVTRRGSWRGHMAHTPSRRSALLVAPPQAHQRTDVPCLTLGPPLAMMEGHGGGIHHRVGHPLRLEKTLPPAAFLTDVRATHHGRGFGQTAAACGVGHCLEQARLVMRRDRAPTWLLTMAWSASELPGSVTQPASIVLYATCGDATMVRQPRG